MALWAGATLCAYPEPDPTFYFDVAPDPTPDPSLILKLGQVNNCKFEVYIIGLPQDF